MNKIEKELSIKEYHDHEAISSTDIKNFIESPLHFKLNRKHKTTTPSQQKGILLHTALLEPEKIPTLFSIEQKIGRNTLVWRKARENALQNGKIIINEEELEQAKTFANYVKQSPVAKFIFDCERVTECSFFAEDEITCLPLKARPDISVQSDEGIILVDYKTTSSNLDLFSIKNYFRNYKVEIQAAFHAKVIELCTYSKVSAFVYIFQSSIHPELIRVVQLEPNMICFANHVIDQTLSNLADTLGVDYLKNKIPLDYALSNQEFKGYETIETIGYKTYYTEQYFEEDF